jgi:hypothetical protein
MQNFKLPQKQQQNSAIHLEQSQWSMFQLQTIKHFKAFHLLEMNNKHFVNMMGISTMRTCQINFYLIKLYDH